LYRLFIILFLCLTGWITSVGQIQPPATPPAPQVPGAGSVLSTNNNALSSNERKLKANRDSALAANKYVHSGKQKPGKKDSLPLARPSSRLARTDSNAAPDPQKFIPTLDHPSCKMVTFAPYTPDSLDFHPATPPAAPRPAAPTPPHVPFLQVHGNVLYNLNYYSLIDTPYNEHNIYQHTIQTWLDVLVKGQYPFRIFLTNHFSNSPLFHNYSDFNFSYNNNGFNQQVRNELRQEYLRSLPSQKVLDSLQRVLNNDLAKLKGLTQWGKNPALIQHMVEAREQSLQKKTPKDSTSADSTSKLAQAKSDEAELDSIYAKRRRDADSISKEITRLEQLLQSTHQLSQTQVDQNLAAIQKLDNPSAVREKSAAMGMSDSSLPKGYKTLMAVKSFSIGRSMVNYSELSAKNISINGVQAEYNPGLYYAVAAGTIDYRFRDFVIQQPDEPRQYMSVFRIGEGLKGGNSVILTYFSGRRQLYSATTSDTVTTQVPASFLMGLTLEGNYHLTKNILFTGEIAKSSSPYYAGDSAKSANPSADLFRMNDHSNEAWSMKVNAFFPATDTRLTGYYKHMAENYQSFSIFTDGSAQSAWAINLDQPLFKKQLDIRLGANTNDFSNPLVGEEYSSTTVFESIQATFRRKNWPTISLGYFPSSQITKLGDGQYIENLFYTLVGNLTQSYSFHHLLMNTTVVYTQFYNKAADSGFTYFNTRNLLVSQSVFLSKFTLQLNATGSENENYDLYTLEGKAQHTVNKWLTVGAGIKYNHQTVYNIDQFGYSAEATLRLNRLGQIQFSADKGFIPGMNNVLVPDNTGRLTYFKTF
jgi:hypothetical protein